MDHSWLKLPNQTQRTLKMGNFNEEKVLVTDLDFQLSIPSLGKWSERFMTLEEYEVPYKGT